MRKTQEEATTTIPISQVEPNPHQPRDQAEEDEELQELAASIARHGVLQPILVRPVEGGRYQIVAGERRWRAAQMAGLEEIPCVVREVDESQMLVLALVENLQRSDLNPIETAQGYQRLMDEFGLRQEEVAELVGKSRTAVTNTVRLLQLPEQVQELICEGKLSEGHGRALLGMQKDPEGLVRAAQKAAKEGLSVRELEKIVQQSPTKRAFSSPRRPRLTGEEELTPELQAVREALKRYLATGVRIRPIGRGGVIEIDYYDDEDLTRLLEIIMGSGGESEAEI